VVVGLSLGSLLALRLAIDRPDAIGGLVLLSSALVLANPWPARVGRILQPLVPWLPRRWQYVHKGASDIADEAARAIHPGYRAMPLRGILELVALQREVRRVLPLVQQPALIIHSAQDHTAPLVNLTVLQQALPSVRRTVVLEELPAHRRRREGSRGARDSVCRRHRGVAQISTRWRSARSTLNPKSGCRGRCRALSHFCRHARSENRRGSAFILCENRPIRDRFALSASPGGLCRVRARTPSSREKGGEAMRGSSCGA
jgi:alpha-beta hydrolase superfamily lysophospholipase